MPSPHTSASNTGATASLSNVILARVNQDVIFSSLGGVLLSLNPGRSVPYSTLSSTSNSVGASSSSSFSSAPLQTEGAEGDREESEDQDEDEDRFKEISTSKPSASGRKSSAALSRLAAVTKANPHSPPKTKAARGKGSNNTSGINGVTDTEAAKESAKLSEEAAKSSEALAETDVDGRIDVVDKEVGLGENMGLKVG